MIRPEDDSFHPGSDDPYWNESAIFLFMVPERELSGWFYFYHRPNMNYTVGGLALWDRSGEETYDCLHYDFNFPFALPPGAKMYDFSLPNGVSVKSREPLKSYSLKYDGEGCQAEFEWNGVIPPQDTGLPEGSDGWGHHHYEQIGRMEGYIDLDGERITVSCWSFRDHSWGPRAYIENPRASFAWAAASAESSFAVWGLTEHPAETDPVFGTTEKLIYGWFVRDGVPALVSSGHLRVTDRGEDSRPLAMEIRGSDELGRDLMATGRMKNWLKTPLYPFLSMWWSLAEWEFDGQTAWGEEQDFYPNLHHRRFLRSLRATGGQRAPVWQPT